MVGNKVCKIILWLLFGSRFNPIRPMPFWESLIDRRCSIRQPWVHCLISWIVSTKERKVSLIAWAVLKLNIRNNRRLRHVLFFTLFIYLQSCFLLLFQDFLFLLFDVSSLINFVIKGFVIFVLDLSEISWLRLHTSLFSF